MNKSQRQSAATIVSFALVAPMFFFLVFAISEGARVFNAYVVITNEAREAARYGAVHYDATQTPAAQQTAVYSYLMQRLNGTVDQTQLVPAPIIKVTPGTTTPFTEPMVDVTVSYRVQLVIPMISAVLPNPFPIQTRSIMVGEPDS
jgi:Flp pilus assembly protein TadG